MNRDKKNLDRVWRSVRALARNSTGQPQPDGYLNNGSELLSKREFLNRHIPHNSNKGA